MGGVECSSLLVYFDRKSLIDKCNLGSKVRVFNIGWGCIDMNFWVFAYAVPEVWNSESFTRLIVLLGLRQF